MDSERIIIHVDMDAFFASVEQKENPALRGKPVAVCGDSTARTVIAACSYEAKKAGVKSGMPVSLGKSLCPELILVEGDMPKYAAVSTAIMGVLSVYSDMVEEFSIDEAFLDITHTKHLFGGKKETAERIKKHIFSSSGLPCSIGVGPNKLLAKLATGMGKPDGLTVLENAEEVLAELPAGKLCGIGAKTAAGLNEMGIRTCGELGRAPAQNLRAKFGIYGDILSKMGRGEDDSPVARSGKTKSAGHSLTLPADTADSSEIERVLLSLSEEVSARLREGGFRGNTVTLTLRYGDFSTFTFQAKAQQTDNGYRIFAAALQLFKKHFSGRPVRMAGVKVSGLRKEPGQLYLFERDEKEERLQEAVDNIRRKLGNSAIVRAGTVMKEKSRSKVKPQAGPR